MTRRAAAVIVVLASCQRQPAPVPSEPDHHAVAAPEAPKPAPPAPHACTVPQVTLSPTGITIEVTGSPATHLAPGDFDRMRAALAGIKAHDEACTQLEIDGDRGVRYQDVITAVDLATQIGFADVALTHGGPAGAAAGSAAGGSATAPASQAQDLKTAPVIIVTPTELRVGSAAVGSTADALAGSGDLAALAHALPRPSRTPATAIIQADKDTDAIVIDRVITTLQHAGYDNVLFAVKNK